MTGQLIDFDEGPVRYEWGAWTAVEADDGDWRAAASNELVSLARELRAKTSELEALRMKGRPERVQELEEMNSRLAGQVEDRESRIEDYALRLRELTATIEQQKATIRSMQAEHQPYAKLSYGKPIDRIEWTSTPMVFPLGESLALAAKVELAQWMVNNTNDPESKKAAEFLAGLLG